MTNDELIKIAMQSGLDIDENDNITGGTVDALQKFRLRLPNYSNSDTSASTSATLCVNVDMTNHLERIMAAKEALAPVASEIARSAEQLSLVLGEALSVLEYNWENYPEAGSQSDFETIQKLRAILSDNSVPSGTVQPVTTMAIDVQDGQLAIMDSNGKNLVVLGNLGALDKSITALAEQ